MTHRSPTIAGTISGRISGRTPSRTAGAPIRALEVGLIRLYRATLSGWLGGQCRFYPSCSRYAEDAIRELGAVKGTFLAVWRVLRCNPFGSGGIDRVSDLSQYENVIHREDDRRVET
ncbi:MAG: membrane protein insertion efficiency factor YidD [Actinomycetota bacterium]